MSSSSPSSQERLAETPVLRRTRADFRATAVLACLTIIAVAIVWFTADSRTAHLHVNSALPAEAAAVPPHDLPRAMTTAWEAPSTSIDGVYAPVTLNGVTLTVDRNEVHDSVVKALDARGETVWTYSRAMQVCSVQAAFGTFFVVYRAAAGCGDVMGFTPAGGYGPSRSAIMPNQAMPVVSNDSAGLLGPARVELWRSDLVRTVEYGRVEAPQEPKMQPNPECAPYSALTRKNLLGIVETCRDGSVNLRIMGTTPEDSRAPEVTATVELLPPAESRNQQYDPGLPYLVAIDINKATVFFPAGRKGSHAPDDPPVVVTYDDKGAELSATITSGEVPPPPTVTGRIADAGAYHGTKNEVLPDGEGSAVAPATKDLAHHMTWWDGRSLHVFEAGSLKASYARAEAIGTGVTLSPNPATPNTSLAIFPTREGLEIIDETSAEVVRTVAVDRGAYDGPVYLGWVGSTLVEHRGDQLVGLQPAG